MNMLLMIGTGEIIVIVLVVLLIFGGKKIPELMKGLGKGMRSFKEGVNGVEDAVSEDVMESDKSDSAKKTNKKSVKKEDAE